MNAPLVISQSPHIKSSVRTQTLMGIVHLALLPALVVQTWFHGWAFVKVLTLFVLTCVAMEYLVQRFLLRERSTVGDLSAALTGVLLALNVPATLEIFPIFSGSAVAIGLGKLAFGGIGRNPFNPALVGRAFLLASFPVQMTTWPPALATAVDATSGATPLTQLSLGIAPLGWTEKVAAGWDPSIWSWEILAGAYLLGGLALITAGVITWHIPVSYLAGLGALTLPVWLLVPGSADPLFHWVMGGTLLGAFFMATDYATSPMIPLTQLLYGLGGGLLCGVIRLWGAFPDGVAYSILIMNATVPILNRYLQPRRFGRTR